MEYKEPDDGVTLALRRRVTISTGQCMDDEVPGTGGEGSSFQLLCIL